MSTDCTARDAVPRCSATPAVPPLPRISVFHVERVVDGRLPMPRRMRRSNGDFLRALILGSASRATRIWASQGRCALRCSTWNGLLMAGGPRLAGERQSDGDILRRAHVEGLRASRYLALGYPAPRAFRRSTRKRVVDSRLSTPRRRAPSNPDLLRRVHSRAPRFPRYTALRLPAPPRSSVIHAERVVDGRLSTPRRRAPLKLGTCSVSLTVGPPPASHATRLLAS